MLYNTLYKLKVGKKLKVGYFGGSITEGAGAEDREKNCWRAISRDWFKNEYPDAEITEIYAAIGGTGTGLATFRAERDLIRYEPDLIFIEYAVNDDGNDFDDIAKNTEALFRKLRRRLPTADLVLILTTSGDINRMRDEGKEFPAATAQLLAAHRYGGEVIDPGAALHSACLASGENYEEGFTADGLHPNNRGYRIMADCVISNLKRLLDTEVPDAVVPYTVTASPIYEGETEFADMIPVDELQNVVSDGFVMGDSAANDTLPLIYSSNKPGASVSFDFDGTLFGIYWTTARANTDILLSIDGEEPRQVGSWDRYLRSFHRFNAALIRRDLAPGHHRATVKALDCDDAFVGFSAIFVLNK